MRKESLVAQPHRPHQKPARQLHPADLPDPLSDSRDVPMASADDLLSEIVGDDVERLMSGEYEPLGVTPGHKAVERLQHQIGKFLDEVRQREQAAPPPPITMTPTPTPSAMSATPRVQAPPATAPQPPLHPVYEDEIAPSLDDLVGPTHE